MFAAILKILRAEPAVVAGATVSIVEALLSPDWKAAVPVALSLVIRQAVSSAIKTAPAPVVVPPPAP